MNDYQHKIKKNIQTILKRLKFEDNKLKDIKDGVLIEDYFKADSSASRVLNFDENFKLINGLSEFIYTLYRNDTSFSNLGSTFKFEIENDYWLSSYWSLDEKNKTIRKEGEKRIAVAGDYFKKEIQTDPNSLDDQYLKVDLIYPKTGFSTETEVVNSSNITQIKYRYIYGKSSLFDDYLMRFYFTFNPFFDILKGFILSIQENFNDNHIPFEFKFIESSDKYNSLDTGVLYLSRKHAHISFEIVREVYSSFKDKKEHDVNFFVEKEMMFTYQIDKGFSFAENPDDERYGSFGKYASILVAKSIVNCLKEINFEKNDDVDVNKVIEDIEKRATKIEFLYKNPASRISYNFEFLKSNLRQRELSHLVKPSKGDKKYLEIAKIIANKICKEAIWDNGYCNWVSCTGNIFDNPIGIGINEKIIGYKYELLDDISLQTGRLGIAYFLTKLYSIFSDVTYKRTAEGAVQTLLTDASKINVSSFFVLSELNNQFKENKYSQILKSYQPKTTLNSESKQFFFELTSKNTEIIAKFINHWRIAGFANQAFKDIIDNEAITIADEIIEEYFNKDRVFGNAFGNDEFNPTLVGGYAMLGYFFLRIYEPNVPLLPFKFESVPQSDNQFLFQVSTDLTSHLSL